MEKKRIIASLSAAVLLAGLFSTPAFADSETTTPSTSTETTTTQPTTSETTTPSTGSETTPSTGSETTTPSTGSETTPSTGSETTPSTGSETTPSTGSETTTPSTGSETTTPSTGSETTPSTSDAIDYSKAITINKVTLEDMGVYTAGVAIDYSVNPALADKVAYAEVHLRVNTLNSGTDGFHSYGSPTAVNDSKLDLEAYNRITGVKTDPQTGKEYQLFNRMDGTGDNTNNPLNEEGSRVLKEPLNLELPNGTYNISLIGLLSNHQYNAGDVTAQMHIVFKDKVKFKYGDGTIVLEDIDAYSNIYELDAFKTLPKPADPSEDVLNDSNRNGVEGKDAVGKAGSIYRLYIKNLQDSCKDKYGCFWLAYIYSSPKALQDSIGAPFVTLKTKGDANPYVDVVLPEGFKGTHKIALYDQQGNLKGWAPVVIASDGKVLAETGANTTTILTVSGILVLAGVSLSLWNRRRVS